MYKKIYAVYFSPVGKTKKYAVSAAEKISSVLKLEYSEIDITLPESREKNYSFGKNDVVIFCFPVYAGKLPNKLLPFIKTITADGASAICIVTYGNRSFDNALAELAKITSENGFTVTGGAACVCEHSFSDKLASARPNDADFRELDTLCEKICGKLLIGDTSLPQIPGDADAPYYTPLRADGGPAVFLKAKPKTDSVLCDNCGICARVCPMGSVNKENPSEITVICIKCRACVKKCPKKAKFFDDEAFLSHVAMLEANYTAHSENAFFL